MSLAEDLEKLLQQCEGQDDLPQAAGEPALIGNGHTGHATANTGVVAEEQRPLRSWEGRLTYRHSDAPSTPPATEPQAHQAEQLCSAVPVTPTKQLIHSGRGVLGAQAGGMEGEQHEGPYLMADSMAQPWLKPVVRPCNPVGMSPLPDGSMRMSFVCNSAAELLCNSQQGSSKQMEATAAHLALLPPHPPPTTPMRSGTVAAPAAGLSASSSATSSSASATAAACTQEAQLTDDAGTSSSGWQARPPVAPAGAHALSIGPAPQLLAHPPSPQSNLLSHAQLVAQLEAELAEIERRYIDGTPAGSEVGETPRRWRSSSGMGSGQQQLQQHSTAGGSRLQSPSFTGSGDDGGSGSPTRPRLAARSSPGGYQQQQQATPSRFSESSQLLLLQQQLHLHASQQQDITDPPTDGAAVSSISPRRRTRSEVGVQAALPPPHGSASTVSSPFQSPSPSPSPSRWGPRDRDWQPRTVSLPGSAAAAQGMVEWQSMPRSPADSPVLSLVATLLADDVAAFASSARVAAAAACDSEASSALEAVVEAAEEVVAAVAGAATAAERRLRGSSGGGSRLGSAGSSRLLGTSSSSGQLAAALAGLDLSRLEAGIALGSGVGDRDWGSSGVTLRPATASSARDRVSAGGCMLSLHGEMATAAHSAPPTGRSAALQQTSGDTAAGAVRSLLRAFHRAEADPAAPDSSGSPQQQKQWLQQQAGSSDATLQPAGLDGQFLPEFAFTPAPSQPHHHDTHLSEARLPVSHMVQSMLAGSSSAAYGSAQQQQEQLAQLPGDKAHSLEADTLGEQVAPAWPNGPSAARALDALLAHHASAAPSMAPQLAELSEGDELSLDLDSAHELRITMTGLVQPDGPATDEPRSSAEPLGAELMPLVDTRGPGEAAQAAAAAEAQGTASSQEDYRLDVRRRALASLQERLRDVQATIQERKDSRAACHTSPGANGSSEALSIHFARDGVAAHAAGAPMPALNISPPNTAQAAAAIPAGDVGPAASVLRLSAREQLAEAYTFGLTSYSASPAAKRLDASSSSRAAFSSPRASPPLSKRYGAPWQPETDVRSPLASLQQLLSPAPSQQQSPTPTHAPSRVVTGWATGSPTNVRASSGSATTATSPAGDGAGAMASANGWAPSQQLAASRAGNGVVALAMGVPVAASGRPSGPQWDEGEVVLLDLRSEVSLQTWPRPIRTGTSSHNDTLPAGSPAGSHPSPLAGVSTGPAPHGSGAQQQHSWMQHSSSMPHPPSQARPAAAVAAQLLPAKAEPRPATAPSRWGAAPEQPTGRIGVQVPPAAGASLAARLAAMPQRASAGSGHYAPSSPHSAASPLLQQQQRAVSASSMTCSGSFVTAAARPQYANHSVTTVLPSPHSSLQTPAYMPYGAPTRPASLVTTFVEAAPFAAERTQGAAASPSSGSWSPYLHTTRPVLLSPPPHYPQQLQFVTVPQLHSPSSSGNGAPLQRMAQWRQVEKAIATRLASVPLQDTDPSPAAAPAGVKRQASSGRMPSRNQGTPHAGSGNSSPWLSRLLEDDHSADDSRPHSPGRYGRSAGAATIVAADSPGPGVRAVAGVSLQRSSSAQRPKVALQPVGGPRVGGLGLAAGGGSAATASNGSGMAGAGRGVLDTALALVHRRVAPNSTLAYAMDLEWKQMRAAAAVQACTLGTPQRRR